MVFPLIDLRVQEEVVDDGWMVHTWNLSHLPLRKCWVQRHKPHLWTWHCNVWIDWQMDKLMNERHISHPPTLRCREAFYYKVAGDHMALAERGGGPAGMWPCRWQAEFWSRRLASATNGSFSRPNPGVVRRRAINQSVSWHRWLYGLPCDAYRNIRELFKGTICHMCIILVLESAQWEADVVSGMFMFCMPEALLLVVLRSVRNLLTLKLQPDLRSILEQLW